MVVKSNMREELIAIDNYEDGQWDRLRWITGAEGSNCDETAVFNMDDSPDVNAGEHNPTMHRDSIQLFSPCSEYARLLLSLVYCATVMLMMAADLVYVQNRVYHMKDHPPLPDIVLDHLGPISWALAACEICMVILFCIWLATIVFHKHRIVLLRRHFYLQGSMFLIRIVTAAVTGLPLIDIHRNIPFKEYPSAKEHTKRTFEIASSMALSITAKDEAVLTYGDYIFSGHMMLATLLTCLISKYSPKSFWWLRFATVGVYIAAAVFILAAHAHYTIDVVLAMFLTMQYFLHYHVLLELRTMTNYQPSIIHNFIFPFYSFFEKSKMKYHNVYDKPQHFARLASQAWSNFRARTL